MATRTIEISLKDADLDGVKIANLSNRVARIYVVPRTKLPFLDSRPELKTPALYFLFDEERTEVYIGECENAQSRITQHDASKEFWSTAVICVSVDYGLDKADVKFLEAYAIQKAGDIGRLNVQNRTNPPENHLKEFKREAVLELFEDFELLLTTLGYTLFEKFEDTTRIAKPESVKVERDVREFDTIVCPSSGSGRVDAFEAKNAWWAVRIWKGNLAKLKYVGLYEAAPVSAIRCYAKITKIEPYPDEPRKYIIHHDGTIIDLEHPVVLGDNPELSLYGPRYYKLADIKSSNTLQELTDKAFGTH